MPGPKKLFDGEKMSDGVFCSMASGPVGGGKGGMRKGYKTILKECQLLLFPIKVLNAWMRRNRYFKGNRMPEQSNTIRPFQTFVTGTFWR